MLVELDNLYFGNINKVRGGCCIVGLLNLAELNLHPRPCPDIACFCAEKGR